MKLHKVAATYCKGGKSQRAYFGSGLTLHTSPIIGSDLIKEDINTCARDLQHTWGRITIAGSFFFNIPKFYIRKHFHVFCQRTIMRRHVSTLMLTTSMQITQVSTLLSSNLRRRGRVGNVRQSFTRATDYRFIYNPAEESRNRTNKRCSLRHAVTRVI